MALVTFRCPQTGQHVSSGIHVLPREWNGAARFFAYTRCPICLIDHEWTETDVKIEPPETASAA
jgi:hypothetical protein